MSQDFQKIEDQSFFWSRLITFVFFLGIFAFAYFPSNSLVTGITSNYLPIHMVLEGMGILVSFGIFTVGWATFQNVRSTNILVLSIVSFVVGWLDFGHTLSFTGMPDFVTPSGPNKAIDFWLVSRLVGSFGILYVALSRPREVPAPWIRHGLLWAAIAGTATTYYVILYHPEILPIMFVPGQGLTTLKLILETTAIGISFISGYLFFRQGVKRELFSFHWMGCGSMIFGMSGLFFTMYRDFDDLYNFAGHVYKAFGYVLLYRAVFVECISKPYLEAQRLATEASQASNAKTRFLANVSHELRTPLGVISGFSDMFVQQKDLPEEPRKWAETISRNSRQLRFLIDDLLDLAKAENEKINVIFSTFNAAEVIEEVIAGLRPQAEKKGVVITFQSEIPGMQRLTSDKVRFRQIFLNLIGNAVKFTPKGSIDILLKSQDDLFSVEVQDSGIGLTSEQSAKLFRPFSQVDDPMNRRLGGTGLGLALSKKLANLLGGNLWIERTAPDQGSTFKFTVLDRKDQATAEVTKKKEVPIPQFESRRILAAEDSPDNQSILEIYLQGTSAKLVFANNGKEAIDLMTKEKFDLVLMDIQMPEMDGFEAVMHIRGTGWQGPILALSAHAHPPERERAKQVGFTGYLTKPISRDKLWAAMSEHL